MPDSDAHRGIPRFERDAIDEIARLNRELEASRQRRAAAAQAFEAAITSFDATAAPPSGGATPTRSTREALEGPRASRTPPAPPVAPARAGHEPVRRDRPAPGRRTAAAAAAIVVGAALAMVVLLPRGAERALDGEPAGMPPSLAEPTDPVPLAEPSPAHPAVELVTSRQVWMRVTLDGERVLEREIAAGTRLPFDDGGALVVRAGDGGAVRLVLRGEDQGVLGPDGAVVTRTFTVE